MPQIELHLRAAAERARQEVAAAAQRHVLPWSFEIVRGAAETVLSAVSEHDLVVAGALTRPIAGYFRVECRWWSSIELAPGPFLLARQAWSANARVAALLRDRNPGSARLLRAAAQMAEAGGGGLTAMCPPALAAAVGLEKWIAQQIAAFSVPWQIAVAPTEPAALPRRIVELDCRLLAIEAGAVESAGGRLREFAERLACDVLIVR